MWPIREEAISSGPGRPGRGRVPSARPSAAAAFSTECPKGQAPDTSFAKGTSLLSPYSALDDPANGDGAFLPVAAERRDLDVLSGLGRLDDQPGADVHADVAGLRGRAVGAGCKQQVAWLELAV